MFPFVVAGVVVVVVERGASVEEETEEEEEEIGFLGEALAARTSLTVRSM